MSVRTVMLTGEGNGNETEGSPWGEEGSDPPCDALPFRFTPETLALDDREVTTGVRLDSLTEAP
jgi:hypothetical protein